MTNVPRPDLHISCQDLLSMGEYSWAGWLRRRYDLLPDLSKLNRIKFMSKITGKIKVKPWFQKYIIVCNGCLYLYRNERAKSPSAAYSLFGYNQITRAGDVPQNEAPWAFKVVHTHSIVKTHYYSAASEPELAKLMKAFKKEMNFSNGKYQKVFEEDNSETNSEFYSDIEEPIYEDEELENIRSNYFDMKKSGAIKEEEEEDEILASLDEEDPYYDEGQSLDAPLQEAPSPPGISRVPSVPPKRFEPPSKPARAPLPNPSRSSERPPPPNIPAPDLPLPERPLPERPGGDSDRSNASSLRKKPHRTPSGSSQGSRDEDDEVLPPVSNIKSRIEFLNSDVNNKGKLHSPPPGGQKIPGLFPGAQAAPLKSAEKKPPNLPPPRKTSSGQPNSFKRSSQERSESLSGGNNYEMAFWEGDKSEIKKVLHQIDKDGVYVVRNSDNDPDLHVLVVFNASSEKLLSYKIAHQGSKYWIKDIVKFATINELLDYYTSHDLPTAPMKLSLPYQKASH